MDGVVVTGATGTVGRHVVYELTTRGLRVRALSRRPGLGSAQVQTGRLSFTDPSSWRAAFSGAQTMFLIRPPELVNVGRDLLPAVAAARDAGVRRVVFLSVLGAERNPLLPHRRVERWLESSGMAVTQLRAGNFMQNLTGVHAADIGDRDQLVMPAGDAAMSYVDARDVAAGAVRCLLQEVAARGAWDVTGPAALTHAQVAAALSVVLQRRITYTRPNLLQYWAHARRTDMSASLTAATSVLYTLARAGIGSRVSEDTPGLLGRPPHTIHRFVTDHQQVWRR